MADTNKQHSRNYTRNITTSALLIALAYVLSFVELFRMPQGGAVTLFSMLPIVLLGYVLGTRWGILGGAVLGLLNLLMGGYVIHPVQLFLDYILAFAAMGLSGLVRNKKNGLTLGYLVGIMSRYACAVLSGVVFFGEYAPENFNALTWSLWYNITYIAVEGIMTMILINIPAVQKLIYRFRAYMEN